MPYGGILRGDYIITSSDISNESSIARARSPSRHPGAHGSRGEHRRAVVNVYTAAAKQDNLGLLQRVRGATTLERSVMLGALTKKFANPNIGFGTHGKATTTGMLTQI